MRRAATTVLVLVVVLATGGCGARFEVFGLRVGEDCPVVAQQLSTRAVPDEEANVHLYVTNQSFDDPVVRMAVAVDADPVADQEFDVCGQHDWVLFPLRVDPGGHDLVVTTSDGIRSEARIAVPQAPEGRWVVVSYWSDPEPLIDVVVHSEPVAFA